ncbi:MAG: sensor histidine kinase [Rubripirellula sp.]
MSETAHDLKSPLTTVREAIRIVHDGYVGDVTSDQKGFLSSAMDQCDCIEQMIGEMVQLERLRTGTPRVTRRWVPIQEIRHGIDETLRPWAMPRQIEVLWDGADDSSETVFADPAMLRRLIVNLVTNAVRVTAEGGTILIRIQRQNPDAVRWSVIDQGTGISEANLQQIADQQTSFSGSEGLGLAISRQLAALHFSSLFIRSRLGSGTEVSFDTVAGGPRSIADAWSAWRVAQRGPLKKPQHRDDSEIGQLQKPRLCTPRRMRLDPPVLSVELSHEASKPRCEDRLAAGTVTVGAAVSREAADSFDKLLQTELQMFDLVYRVSTRRWAWFFDTDAHGVQDRIDSIKDAAVAKIPTARTTWSKPQMVPVEARRTTARVSDLIVRESLAASAPNHGLDKNQVRLGTAPIEVSEVASQRLDEELRRLASQMRVQTKNLQQQAKNLRPKR